MNEIKLYSTINDLTRGKLGPSEKQRLKAAIWNLHLEDLKVIDSWRFREELTMAMSACYSKELSTCPKHPIFQPQKAINLILPLIKGTVEK